MKHSLKLKLTMILVGLLSIITAASLLINLFFLDDYYQYTKTNSLSECYGELAEVITSSSVDEENFGENTELSSAIENIENAYNLDVFFITEGFDERGLFIKFLYPSATYFGDVRTSRYERIRDALFSYLFAGEERDSDGSIEFLDQKEGLYGIYKMRDEDTYYIDLIGSMNDRMLVFIRSNYESIEESTAVSNKFLAFVGLFCIVFGAFAMFLFAKSFTKPVAEMSDIAKGMAELDFSKKYSGNRKDEIGELGKSINRVSEQLEQTISELKAANNELFKDNEHKTQIDEMRKEFLSNVSHELKTPIALIRGYAEGLKDIAEDEESRAYYCDVIIDEALKMNNLVQKLLSLNRIEFGRQELDIERFDITSLVRGVVENSEILLKQNRIKAMIHEEDPIHVWADQFMIEEVVTNYLSNAINHIDGERVIDIKYAINEDTVRISVFNTGEPIAEEDIDKVWIKFFKADKARTREYGGSGIGLSIVKAIMDSHHRQCGVINHDNGVEFWFELDCGKSEKILQ